MGKLLKTIILHAKSSRALKDASLLVVLQVVTQANNLIATLAITRYLGPSNMGIIAFTQTFVSFTFLLNAGLDNYYLWELASSPEKKQQIISRSFSAKLIINGVSFSVGLVALLSLNASAGETIIVIGALLLALVSSSIGFLAPLLLMEKKVRQYFRAAMFTTFTIITLRLAGVYLHLPVEYFIAVLIGETLILVGYLKFFKFVEFGDLKVFTKNILSSTWREAYAARYYIGIVFASLLFARTDQLFIKELLTTSDLGVYSAAVRLAELPMVFIGVLATVIMPRITAANGEEKRARMALLSGALFAISGITLMILFIFFGGLFIHIVYGSQFLAATPILAIYAIGLPGLWINSFAGLIFSSYHRVHYGLYIAIVGGITSISLLTIFVPHYGLTGAAASTAASYTVMGVLSLGIGIIFRHKFFAKKPTTNLTLLEQKGQVLANNVRE